MGILFCPENMGQEEIEGSDESNPRSLTEENKIIRHATVKPRN
jgi:hypothetical protein